MVHDLRGMFAFAHLGCRARRLFLARDPYGIKPLYYADDGWTFRFASQVKALLAGGAISREPEPAGQVGILFVGQRARAIHRLSRHPRAAGRHDAHGRPIGAHAPRRYHSIAAAYGDARAQPAASSRHEVQALKRSATALLDSVRSHLVADVPVGAFLSAGIDSGALVGLMRDAGQQDIQTVTLAFAEFRGKRQDEAPLAEEVAALYGTRHTTRIVTRSRIRGRPAAHPRGHGPAHIDGINTWFVSKAARELGLKVAISGLGGDELFGGYPSFRDIPRWVCGFARCPRASRCSARPCA